MARLGELLIAEGVLSDAQVQTALRAQVMWGGRLGTNLVELAYIDLDALSSVLARQHGLPAALARHFERIDRALQAQLSSTVAERYGCVPLARAPSGAIAVAVMSPLDARGAAIVADELAVAPGAIVQAIAAELRVRYHLERSYEIPRRARFLRARGAAPEFPYREAPEAGSDSGEVDAARTHAQTQELDTAEIEEIEEIAAPAADGGAATAATVVTAAAAVAKPTAAAATPRPLDEHLEPIASGVPAAPAHDGRERRGYIRTLADMVDAGVPTGLDPKTLGRIAIRKIPATKNPPIAAGAFPDATRAIRRASDREVVAELAMEAIDRFAPTCEAAMLLSVRGEVAIGWKGFVRGGEPPPEIAVPFVEHSVVTAACSGRTARCAADDLVAIDRLLIEALGRRDGDLVAVPISIGGQVPCLIAIATATDAPVAAVEAVAAAAGAAFARLMRDASR